MKFEVNAKKFLDVAFPVIRVAKNASKSQKDYEVIALHIKENEAKFLSFSGDMGIEIIFSKEDIGYKYIEEGEVTIKLEDFVNGFPTFEDDDVVVEFDGKEFKITNIVEEKDKYKQESQSFASRTEHLSMPLLANKFFKEIEINRDIFVNNVNKLFYAIGDEEFRPQYLYWKLEVLNEGLKFIIGKGRHFAISIVKGNNLKFGDNTEFLFSKAATKPMLDILSKSNCETITIKQAESANLEEGIAPDQIVITFGEQNLMLLGFDTEINWDDMKFDSVINRTGGINISTNMGNWSRIVKSIKATFSDDTKQETNNPAVDVSIDTNKKTLKVNINYKNAKTSRVIDIISQGDIKNNTVLGFKCNPAHLIEIYDHLDHKEEIVMNIQEQDKPVMIKYNTTDKNSQNAEEQIVVFFATITDG